METKSKKLPIYVAIGVVVCVTLWMLSGFGNMPEQEASTANSRNQSTNNMPQVRIKNAQANEITREILISGRSEPNRMVELRAEAEGIVEQILVDRGMSIEKGAAIFSLDVRGRDERLQEAVSLVKQRELEFEGAQKLQRQQFAGEVQIAEAQAKLDSARAAQGRIQLEIMYTKLAAPFAGVLQERTVELGDFVRIGDSVATLVDLDPIIIAGEVNERNISHLSVGRKGKATLVGGTKVEGTIRYISRVADPATRTFKVELAVPNPSHSIQAGLTAEMSLAADTVTVHTLSSSLLTLADNGVVGVKVVDQNDRVRFYPVNIEGSSLDGIYVSGLPDRVNIITVGQGFVVEGQQVEAITTNVVESGQ